MRSVVSSGFTGAVLAGHIHQAPAGFNGGVVVDLQVISANHSICVPADKALIKDIRKHPAEYYINIHSAGFTGGEVRGQLSK